MSDIMSSSDSMSDSSSELNNELINELNKWEPLTDFEDDYEVETEPPHRIRRKRDGLMPKPSLVKRSGYVQVKLNGNTYRYHRILAKHFIPNPDNLPEVDHINQDKTDNALENLRWVNRSQNLKNRAKYVKQKSEFLDHAPNDIIEIRAFNDVEYEENKYFFCFENDRVVLRVNDHKWRYLNMTPHTGYLCVVLRDINGRSHQIYMHKLIKHFRTVPADELSDEEL